MGEIESHSHLAWFVILNKCRDKMSASCDPNNEIIARYDIGWWKRATREGKDACQDGDCRVQEGGRGAEEGACNEIECCLYGCRITYVNWEAFIN